MSIPTIELISSAVRLLISWLLEEYDSFQHLRRILHQLDSWNGMSNWFFTGSGRLLSEEEYPGLEYILVSSCSFDEYL